jgi:hypothetical protein
MGDSRPSPAVPKFHRRATVIALRSSCGPESDNPCAEFETIGLRKKQQTLRTRPLHHAGGTLYSPPRGQLCSKLFYAYPDLEPTSNKTALWKIPIQKFTLIEN